MGMTIEELLKDKYKLRIPPTVYYDLLADIQDIEAIQKDQYEQQAKHLRALQNRCCALTMGAMCQFCAMDCGSRKEKYRGD